MIISDRYRFVFIHIPKCLGSYLQWHLGEYDDGKEEKFGFAALIGKLTTDFLLINEKTRADIFFIPEEPSISDCGKA